MKSFKLLLLAMMVAMTAIVAQSATIELKTAKFRVGDNQAWKNMNIDDSNWKTVDVTTEWTASFPDSYAWCRFKFTLPECDKKAMKDKCVSFLLGKIDDCDETYLNGHLIGKTGTTPTDPQGYRTKWNEERAYRLLVADKALKWGQENILAIRIYNGGDPGGMNANGVKIICDDDAVNALSFSLKDAANGKCKAVLKNGIGVPQKGVVKITVSEPESKKVISVTEKKVSVKAGGETSLLVDAPSSGEMVKVDAVFTNQAGKSIAARCVPKYILTPDEPLTPRYNGPTVYGVRPGSPVIYRMPFSGERPMKYAVENLPEGLSVDAERGVISGSIAKKGDYKMTLVAKNGKGEARAEFTIKVGLELALTPPMGWNSWNCWGLSVTQDKVVSSAQAMIDKGLADYGYNYINIDDAWEAEERNADGTIGVNEKFQDMKALGDWLHANGLKFGIYSSPGCATCGGYLGSLDHEKQDAETWNSWGIDYLKYDWCGYSRVFGPDRDKTIAGYLRPYIVMEKYLREQPRDIFYSLCQYGMGEVWRWGHAVDANSWRISGDITDTWQSLREIAFDICPKAQNYSEIGHWNDPDMLVVGKVGWANNLRDTRLTADEQYLHISLWALCSANMLIGCDIAQMDEFTKRLLCNNEVNAVLNDELGIQAKEEIVDGEVHIWRRVLSDGSYAVGIFNTGNEDMNVDFGNYFEKLGIGKLASVRDLWRQKDLEATTTTYFVPSHGVKLIKIRY